MREEWPAQWITCAGAPERGQAVCHFRRHVSLSGRPGSYVVHVSADDRFILFVNGERVGEGPARADTDHWRYETYDIAPHMHGGDNVICATVWNWGALSPVAQMGDQTGFLVQGDGAAESEADTGTSWEAKQEKARGFLPVVAKDVPGYYASSPGEFLDGPRCDWRWQSSTDGWAPAALSGAGEPGRYSNANPTGTGTGHNRWLLVRDPLPQMEYTAVAPGRIVRAEGLDLRSLPAAIPAHTTARILFDRGAMTTGYPELSFGRGTGARLRITYAEALVDAAGHKGNRDEIANRSVVGLTDTVLCDGGAARTWSPLYWRAWRYLQIEVATAEEPLSLDSLGVRFSGYPFAERASISSDDPALARIWEVGTRTARMNAHETYMDCPYWEQLQYIGDTRIQALVSYVEFGDDRLARQALDAYDQSRNAEGLTQSRYPSAVNQVIPTFSLYWIGMIHDYWMYRPDEAPLAKWVPHTRSVIDWYAARERPDGLQGRMPWWNYADWTKDFNWGVPPQDPDGGSALLSLAFMAALRDAADLESHLGNAGTADGYRARAARIGDAVARLCWDEARGLLADTPAHAHFSEQTNAMGVLMDAVPAQRRAGVMRAVLAHRMPGGAPPPQGEFSPASIYFRFYVARALDHAGLADEYLGSLGPWRRMLELGLSTWAETEDPSRSDDHAWSAHPNYDLLTLVAGIRPASPGFRTVLVSPHLGGLREFSATMPHPAGEIAVHYREAGGRWDVLVRLPPGVTGSFDWHGRAASLAPGENRLEY